MSDPGNVAWMLTASALVLLMTPGLAFFYGGLVRGKNVVSTMMYSYVAMGVVSVLWVLWGYSLAFGAGGDFIGNFDFIGFRDVSSEGVDGGISPILFAIFQMMFAIITPALITGAFAERFKFTTYIVFLFVWVTVVYVPITHWVWAADGWIAGIGALDFAGGIVVHASAGIAAIVAARMIGSRRQIERGVEPHNVPYVLLGTGLLWFGWFGFNAGSGLLADNVAVMAFLVTNTSAAVAGLVWMILEFQSTGRTSGVGFATGAIAGLASITPAAGFVGPMGAFAIGIVGSAAAYTAVKIMARTGIDDALEVFAVHGVGGIWGSLATGIFAVQAVDDNGVLQNVGLIDGEVGLLWANARAVAAVAVYSGVATFIILKILDVIPGLGIRVEANDEDLGLDITLHGERGYVGDGAD
ncbi:MAG: ammonium transporter [Dehalococcoidia bacterium]|jgi:Amt family ammonium transporter|nr:ammonia channel protein [Chloroflexota bacterium]MDP6056980.1 ammonium transporter [Dehalococcoidia bacterium]MDP7262597.1 ammonium transporter [Dehalococcoidia bacterium]|tara:strand:- start:2171 stop:3406 length:1236 start_codon:yes stop_codon:yes gene_type:complete